MGNSASPPDWNRLVTMARGEVESTLRALPEEVRDPAQRLPVVYERRPGKGLVQDGIEPDTLGLFVGDSWADSVEAHSPLPTQIILFLENIWELAEADEVVYKSEVRTTLLHELGHFLGLNEGDLEDRGLE